MKIDVIEQNELTSIITIQCKKQDIQQVLDTYYTIFKSQSSQQPHQRQLNSNQLFTALQHLYLTLSQTIAIYFLLSDFHPLQHNTLTHKVHQQFSQIFYNLQKQQNSLQIYLIPIQSTQQSQKYIKKLNNLIKQQQFQQSLKSLNQDINKKNQRNLIKNFLIHNLQFTKQESFQWIKANQINILNDLLMFKKFPSYQKKEIEKLLQKLLKVEMYEKQLKQNSST